MMAMDGKAKLQMVSFQAPKIRLLRNLSIEASEGMQVYPNYQANPILNMMPGWFGNSDVILMNVLIVEKVCRFFVINMYDVLCRNSVFKICMQILDFAVFPEQEFDLPIFCANFFTTPTTNIIVL
ncbi:hypothetical protein CK203_080140 [Vitis vinifera]|uniref:Uncharacterized protein n=1 Tax=Vitis vinifera TaxID=29760 RepID=A0A438F2P2_VITVI|nr:hypothetical protein CK203_080140 [Vitis vinifera]